jgi:hypothetical protein
MVIYSIELVLSLPFQLFNPGLYGPQPSVGLSARQLEHIYPGHSDDGALLGCSEQSLHKLGLPSRIMPFHQYFPKIMPEDTTVHHSGQPAAMFAVSFLLIATTTETADM